MSAQFKEVCRDVDVIAAKEPLPDLRDLPFQQRSWCGIVPRTARPVHVGADRQRCRCKPATIKLALRRQRQRLEDEPFPGHHRLRQPPDEIPAQRRDIECRLGPWHDAGPQYFLCAATCLLAIADHHHRLVHAGKVGQRRLDLTRLDAVAADLHLPILAAKKLNRSVGQPAATVARAVEPRTGRRRKRVGYELRRRELRLVQVANGQSGATDEQFARHADGHRLQRLVHDTTARADQWPPDRRRPMRKRLIATDRVRAGEGRRLGGPVPVDEPRLGQQRDRLADVWHRQHVATSQNVAHRGEDLRAEVDHVIEEPGREPKTVDAFIPDHMPEPVEIGMAIGKYNACATMEQGGPELKR